ncbi:MAG TPA: hypothetical protein VF628_09830 [Allosphingosinicella sp.]|jgi:putative SOS response-associated peptidase YedK
MTAKQAEVAIRFSFDPALIMPEPERPPQPELFPRCHGWVVRKEAGQRTLEIVKWGFPSPGTSRPCDRNLASPFWRPALKNPERRCLVPVTALCEWEGER